MKFKLTLSLLFVCSFSLNAQTTAVGTTEGVFNVSDLGGAGYSIPLTIPAGINGMQPSLSIAYSSQGGNGLCGTGWNLSGGISAISRIANTIYNDKKVTGVSLSSEDRFALDGQRLIITGGSAYSAPGTSYHTEVESFKDIKAIGSLGSGPMSFEVVDQGSGLKYQYGIQTLSRPIVTNKAEPYMWLLDKVTDLNGNFMEYTYQYDAGEEPRLAKISYTGNSNTGAQAKTVILFGYDSRPDPNFSFIAGGKIEQKYRLGTIHIVQHDAVGAPFAVRFYHLVYTTDVYSHLTKVIVRGHELNGPPEELPATEFTYGNTTAASAETQGLPAQNIGVDFAVGDYNADGRSDLIRYTRNYDASNNNWDLYLNNGNQFTLTQTGALPPMPSQYSDKKYEGLVFGRYYYPMFTDYNGDGKEDFIYQSTYIDPGNLNIAIPYKKMYVLLSNGTGLTPLPNKIIRYDYGVDPKDYFLNNSPFSGDFDGDGKTEVLMLNTYRADKPNYDPNNNYLIGENYLKPQVVNGENVLKASPLQGMSFDASYIAAEKQKLYVIDYDGDKKNEILSVWLDASNNTHAQVLRLNVTYDANNKPVVGNPAFVMVNDGAYPSIYHEAFPGDFNGDGVTDMLTWISSAGWQIAYGDGSGKMNLSVLNAPFTLAPPKAGNVYRPILLADFNGDGKTDIFDYGSGAYGSSVSAPRILYSKGNNSFDAEGLSGIPTSKLGPVTYTYWPGDFNGDGSMDFLTANNINNPSYVFSFHPNEFRHSVVQIKNGLGATTKVNYSYLTNTSIYKPGNVIFSYPYIKRTVPFRVVASANTDNGINTIGNNVNYTYEGLKFNAHGKGLLGFSKVTTFDVTKNITQEKVFALNTNYALPYLESSVVRQGQQLLNTSSSQQQVYDYGAKRILPYTTSTTSTDYIKNTTVTETYAYNWPAPNVFYPSPNSAQTGKPTSITTNKGNGLESITQAFTYPNFNTYNGQMMTFTPSWVYMKPQSITTTSIRQGQPAYIRKQDFTYGNVNGLLLSAVSDPGTSHAQTTTNTYNAYGNLLQKTVSAAGVSPRTDVYQYDPSNRYVIKSYNADYPALQTNTEYDMVTGTVSKIIQADGFTQTFMYEGFNRVKTTMDNNGGNVTTGNIWATGNVYAPSNASYGVWTSESTGELSYAFYDRLGRIVRTANKGLNGQMIFVDQNYDNRGQLISKTDPYFQGNAIQNSNWTYDPLGRTIYQSTPSGNNTSYAYAVTPNGALATTTNAAGQTNKTHTDKAGKVVKTEDEGGILEYIYNSNGNVKTTNLNGTTVQQYEYDPYGRNTKRTDPNYGSYEYTYNNLDEVLSEKDPKGQVYNYTYNSLGKMTTKSGPDGTYAYIYNTTGGPNSGKLVQFTGPNSVTHNYNYGMGDKVNYEERIIGNETFKMEFTYDAYGRLRLKKFPNNTIVEYGYSTTNGSLKSVGRPGATYNVPSPFGNTQQPAYLYSIVEENAFGQTTKAGYQSQFIAGTASSIPFTFSSSTSYNAYGILTGQNTFKQSTNGGPIPTICNYGYNFQPSTGNLLQRKDLKYNLQENFTYDNVNRLIGIQGQTTGTNPGVIGTWSMNYTQNGNITQKSDAGTFGYDQANRVSEVNPYVNIPTTTQNIIYTPFDKVATIDEAPNKAQFAYWADQERAKMELLENNVLKKTKYYAADYEKEIDATTGQVRELCYIYGADDNLVSIIEKKNGVEKIYFVQTDYLGSITQIFDGNGTMVEEKSFDAWGRARNPQTWQVLPPVIASNGWDRGYTGQEHLTQFGIINLNGRLYDPLLGRMMEPDPLIIGNNNSQGYNRYSYALNNPLKYADPDGHNPVLIAAAIGAGISALMYTARVAYSPGGFDNWNWGKFALNVGVGAASGAATAGIGSAFGAPFSQGVLGEVFRASFHGVVGSMSTALTGGTPTLGGFFAGAAGSFAGSIASIVPDLNVLGGYPFSMGVDGATSVIGGGNFLEGAVSAGLVHALNHKMHEGNADGSSVEKEKWFHNAVGANDALTWTSMGTDAFTGFTLGTKAGRSMGFLYNVTLSEARMNAQLGRRVLGGASRTLGGITFWGGMALDGYGVINYYNQGPKSPNAVSPVRAGVNTLVGLIGMRGGWPGAVFAGIYFMNNGFQGNPSVPYFRPSSVDRTYVAPPSFAPRIKPYPYIGR